jgi:hypothetical protein
MNVAARLQQSLDNSTPDSVPAIRERLHGWN